MMMLSSIDILFLLLVVAACTTTTTSRSFAAATTFDPTMMTAEQQQQMKIASTTIPDAYGSEVMAHVMLQLASYMNIPIDAMSRINSLRSNNFFPYGMTAPDRNTILSILFNNLHADYDIQAAIYFALEDGTYISLDNAFSVTYREPGNSGYSLQNITKKNNPYYKHYISCINHTDGDPLNCTMEEFNASYVECVNNCQLIPCNNNNNNNSSNSTTMIDSTVNNDDDGYGPNSNTTKLCSNYMIQTISDSNVGLLGYVPTTGFCIGFDHRIDSLFGVRPYEGNTIGFCMYDDNMTFVNRSLRGSYAQCGDNGDICNTTFDGGYRSVDYDPRIRPWYISTKKLQSPTWTEPAPSYYGDYIMMTYNEPLYTYVNESYELFDGVIGQTYSLMGINQFLINQFSNSTSRVFIVEEKEPYYMIGTSSYDESYNSFYFTSGNISTNSITKWVMKTNNTISCPSNETLTAMNETVLDVCQVIRRPIHELHDIISYQAFQQYEQNNFTLVQKGRYFHGNHTTADIIPPAYVAYTKLFTTENIRWNVFVVSPVPRSTTDALVKGNMLYTAVCVLATIGFITCLIMFWIMYHKRKEKAIMQSDWRFTCAFLLGCSFINCSSYTLLGENTNPLCMLRMWSFNGLFVCALSPLFVKVWRMARLLTASATFRRTVVTNCQAWLLTLPIIILELILLMITSIIDPPHQNIQLGIGNGIGYQVTQCTQNNRWFVYVQTIFHGSLVLVGCILAYITRDLDPQYGEAKQLAFSMYNIAFTGIITILIISLVELDEVSKIVIQTISVLWGSCCCSLAFVLPRLLQVQKDHEQKRLTKTGSLTSITGISNHKYSGGVNSYNSQPNHDSFMNYNDSFMNYNNSFHVTANGISVGSSHVEKNGKQKDSNPTRRVSFVYDPDTNTMKKQLEIRKGNSCEIVEADKFDAAYQALVDQNLSKSFEGSANGSASSFAEDPDTDVVINHNKIPEIVINNKRESVSLLDVENLPCDETASQSSEKIDEEPIVVSPDSKKNNDDDDDQK